MHFDISLSHGLILFAIKIVSNLRYFCRGFIINQFTSYTPNSLPYLLQVSTALPSWLVSLSFLKVLLDSTILKCISFQKSVSMHTLTPGAAQWFEIEKTRSKSKFTTSFDKRKNTGDSSFSSIVCATSCGKARRK